MYNCAVGDGRVDSPWKKQKVSSIMVDVWSIRIRRGHFLFFIPETLLFPSIGERGKVALRTQCREHFELLRNGFVRESFDYECRYLLDWPECFRDIAVVAELPCGEQFFDEFRPRKVVGRLHGEPCRLEVVPRIEQKTPVFVAGDNCGLAGRIFCRFLCGNVQDKLHALIYADASSRWIRLYSYSEMDVIFKISSRVSPALMSALA